MKKFILSSVTQLTKNVFAFARKKEAILFNRLNFETHCLPLKFSHLQKVAKEMEKKTPNLKFQIPHPRKIRVEVNFACNLRCKYCLVFKNQLDQINEKMDFDTAEKIIAFYKKQIKQGSVMISGGEPFLNWSVVKLFITEIRDPIKIFTNGTILNRDILVVLKKSPYVRVMVSLDGQRKDNKFRKFKNGKEVYPYVIKTIKTLRKNGIKVGIALLCLNHNVKQLFEITKFFSKNLKINYLGYNFPHFVKRIKLNLDIKEYTAQMINLFDFAIKNKIYIDQLAKRFAPLLTKNFRFYSCKLLGEQITFYPNGKTTFCSKIDSLNSEKYDLNYFLKVIPINNSFCRNCPAIGICGGGCFWDGIMRFKNGVDERECILNKQLLDYFLWRIQEVLEKKLSPSLVFKHFLR